MRSGHFIESYDKLVNLTDNPVKMAWSWILVLVLALAPLVLDSFWTSICATVLITAIGIIGLNLLVGTTGQISLGHSGFLAVGAYATAILTMDYQVPGIIAILLSGFIAAFFGLIVGIPSLRLKGLYLAITTMAFAIIINHIILNAEDITRGSEGFIIDPLQVFGFSFESDASIYYLSLIILVLTVLGALNLMRSHIGRAWVGIRDHDIAAKVMGINLTTYKLLAFMVSAFFAGIAGSILAFQLQYINVDNFSLLLGIEALSMIIVGGLGSISGSIVGVIFIIFLNELVRITTGIFADDGGTMSLYIHEMKGLLYGVVIVLFLRFEPDGIMGKWRDIKNYWSNWPFHH